MWNDLWMIRKGRENMNLQIDYQEVIAAVQATKPLIMNDERRHQIISKGVGDYVTQVDLSIQSHLQKLLQEKYPEIQFMGEEQKDAHLDVSKPMWILDPIDGTSNLIFGLEHSAVSLALYDGEQVVFGVIYNPYKEETFHAVRGQGSFLNGSPIHVQDAKGMSECLISFGTNPYTRVFKKEFLQFLGEILVRCIDLRRFGSAALDLAYVACGRSGGFVEQNLKPWDVAAGILLIKEAGGVVTGLRGQKIVPTENADILCGAPKVYEELLELAAGYEISTR